MSALREATLTLVRLFVDDGSLAIPASLILIVTAFVASTPWIDAAMIGVAFAIAIMGALVANVVLSARTRERR